MRLNFAAGQHSAHGKAAGSGPSILGVSKELNECFPLLKDLE